MPLGILAVMMLAGCQGDVSDNQPYHLNPNMDYQARYDAQEPSTFWEDGRAMRSPVEGTVARDELYEDDKFYRGKDGDAYVTELPVELTMELVERGQQRYDIYCAVCHSRTAEGNGMAVQRGMLPPPNLHEDIYRARPVGQIFEVITKGSATGNMPGYASQIPTHDRWAITAYLRALQLSRQASIEMVSAEVAKEKEWK
jgi:hypothetical protein